ncbi:MAG: hypothetical protein HQK55_02090 [Deltaproteobacteria bacterium]|nr:hypothetical protein [Deltaproteobacteria bacterium]
MRQRIVFMICILTLISTIMVSTGFAFQNEPPGFRGIPWGTSIKDYIDKDNKIKVTLDNPAGFEMENTGINLVFQKESGDFKDYYREGERLSFADAPVDSITYSFYKDRFFRVMIKYSDMWNYENIKKQLFFVYGPAGEAPNSPKTWWWFGKNVSIGLNYSIYSRGGSISYIYSPIQRDRESDQKKAARNGTEDF